MTINEVMYAISNIEGLSEIQYMDIQQCLEEYERSRTRRKESYFCLSYVYDDIKHVEKFKTKEQRADRFMQLEEKFNKIKSLTYFYEHVDN